MCNKSTYKDKLNSKSSAIQKILDSRDVLDVISSSLLITDSDIRLVYCNKAFLVENNILSSDSVMGLRPGDIIKCSNADNDKGGCGNSPKCKFCNFRLSIIEALTTKNKVTREAILNNSYNKMSAFHITATPFTIDKEDFVSISTIDIMHRKKKELIESVFYHDLINLAGSLDGYFDVITEIDEKEVLSHIPILKQISSQLLYEILSHREIIKAQQNTLEAEVSEIEITEFIEELQDKLKYHSACKKKQIIIESNCNDLVIMSDKRLLERVIINMIKNAAEASNKDQIVKATLTPLFDNILIEVHNDQYIEEDVRSNIFTYGFSTKGEGRGLGTYSIKLLGENLLKGKAWFETSKEAGTSFFLKIPLSIDEE